MEERPVWTEEAVPGEVSLETEVFAEREPVGPGRGQDKPGLVREIYDWVDAIVVTLIAVVVLFTFVFRIVGVKGESMLQTLHPDDRVIITNLFYKPKAGDIVVISRNYTNDENQVKTRDNEPIIKRVIATEGQTVDIDFSTGVVTVDGVQLEETYINTPTNLHYDITFPQRVPENCIFVMGDNRNKSLDSRSSEIGMIDQRYVLGHAVFRVLPFGSFGGLS